MRRILKEATSDSERLSVIGCRLSVSVGFAEPAVGTLHRRFDHAGIARFGRQDELRVTRVPRVEGHCRRGRWLGRAMAYVMGDRLTHKGAKFLLSHSLTSI